MSGRSNKRRWVKNEQEEASISVIDAINEHRKALTDDEFEALAICIGAVPPDGKRTRDWAERKLKSVNRNKFTGLVSLHLMQCSKIDDIAIKIGEWAAPKEKQIIEQSGPDGGPQSHVVVIRKRSPGDSEPDASQ